MREEIINVLNKINQEVVAYKGNNLILDGIITSFQILDLIVELEDAFDIEFKPEQINMESFENVDRIIDMVLSRLGGKHD